MPTTAAAVAPSAPQSPTATAGNSLVNLSWLAPANDGGAPVDKYVVEKAIYPNGPWYEVSTPTTTNYTANGLLNNTTWYFRIKAHNASRLGPAERGRQRGAVLDAGRAAHPAGRPGRHQRHGDLVPAAHRRPADRQVPRAAVAVHGRGHGSTSARLPG